MHAVFLVHWQSHPSRWWRMFRSALMVLGVDLRATVIIAVALRPLAVSANKKAARWGGYF